MTSSGPPDASKYMELLKWLSAASVTSAEAALVDSNNRPFALHELSESESGLIAVDLDGILDSADHVRDEITELLSGEPKADDLETVLVELEIQLAHAARHWRSLVKVLRHRDLWMADDYFERASQLIGE